MQAAAKNILFQVIPVIAALFSALLQSSAQQLPALSPSQITSYDLEQGLLSTCVDAAFLDAQGVLWINPCAIDPMHRSLSFYQFNTYESKIFKWSEQEENGFRQAIIEGVDHDGHLFGKIMPHRRPPDTDSVFFFNPISQEIHFAAIPNKEKDSTTIQKIIVDEQGEVFAFLSSDLDLMIYHIQKDHSELLFRRQINWKWHSNVYEIFQRNFIKQGDNFWFIDYAIDVPANISATPVPELVRFNWITGEIKRFGVEDFFGGQPPKGKDLFYPDRLAVSNGQIYIYLQQWDQFFKIDGATEAIQPIYPFSNLNTTTTAKGAPLVVMATDKNDNIVFIKNYLNTINAILLDGNDQAWDYSSIIRAGYEHNRYNVPNYTKELPWIGSPNFKEKLFFSLTGGLSIIEIQFSSAIQNYLDFSSRRIVEIGNNQFIIHKAGGGELFLLDRKTGQTKPLPREHFLDFKIKYDFVNHVELDPGVVLVPSNNAIIRYDFKDNARRVYPLPGNFDKIASLDNNTLVLIEVEQPISFLDLTNGQVTVYLENQAPFTLPYFVNDVEIARDGRLWLATVSGLWYVDFQQKKSGQFELPEGVKDGQMMCIDEDKRGRLWVGTLTDGLLIIDPLAHSIQTINEEDGLSNNTIVGILVDQGGDRWLSTFNGLTIVDSIGKVLTQVLEADGLSNREGNRNSYHKAGSGELIFGTISGINVIDPQAIKDQLLTQSRLNIQLAGASFFDKKSKQVIQVEDHLHNLEVIRLPATKRFLELKFFLNSYIHSEQNQYAYRLEPLNNTEGNGKEFDWITIGENRELTLTDMQPGKYQLLIQGSDYRGRQPQQPLVINLHVGQYFYRQWWFYVLCLLLLSGAALAWIYRLTQERKRLEEQVALRTREILEDKKLIEQQAQQLQELDQTKSRFFTNITHEFRTPLTLILGPAQQAIRDFGRNQGSQAILKLKTIIQNGKRLLNLVNQILDLNKLEAGKLKPQMVQGDVIPRLQFLVESFNSLAESKGIDLQFKTDLPSFIMDYDLEKLTKIITNLLSNAIKFTPTGGSITLGVLKTPKVLTIKVKDTGIGIPKDQLPFIFDWFFQTNETHGALLGGSGVGLALTKELVQLLGGQIQVESEPGRGTLFQVELPVTREAPFESSAEGRQVSELILPLEEDQFKVKTALIDEDGDKDRILIIEDNESMAAYIASCLGAHYEIIYAENGRLGVEQALEHTPDLVISDVMMPEMDGLEVCQTLKTDERTSHIPIVMLTAKAEVADRIAGLKRGADAYLAKPFAEQELQVQVKKLLELRLLLQKYYSNKIFNRSNGDQELGKALQETVNVEDAFLKRLRTIVEDNLANPELDLNALCQATNMSEWQLRKKVSTLTGSSPMRLVRSIRLEKAKNLLLQSDLTIAEIAYDTGFTDPKYFSKLFSKEEGMPPSDFRSTPDQ